MPWTMKVVVSSTRIDMALDRSALDALDRSPGGLVQRHRPVSVGDAVLLEDLEALLLPGARDAEDGDLLGRVVAQLEAGLDHAPSDDVHPGVGDDAHHHGDLVHAGLLEHELREVLGLGDARVPTDLAVVGGLAAVAAHGVEQGERAAAGADHEPEVAVELGDVARHATVVARVDPLALDLELGGLTRLARLLVADAELLQQLLLADAPLILHLHVRVHGHERAVLELRQRVDLREGHVVLEEQPGERSEDRREPVQLRPGDAERGDHVLRPEVHPRQDRGEVATANPFRARLGDLLDVDPAHVAEHVGRKLADPVVDHAGVVLPLDRGLGVDEDPARHVPADLERQDLAGVRLRLLGGVGELHAARLHPPSRQDLRLDDDGAADVGCDRLGLLGVRRESVLRQRYALARQDPARLVLVEPHRSYAFASSGSFSASISARETMTLDCFQVASSCILPSIMCTPRPSGIASSTFFANLTSSGGGLKTFFAISICTGWSDQAPTQPSRNAARNCVSQPSVSLMSPYGP